MTGFDFDFVHNFDFPELETPSQLPWGNSDEGPVPRVSRGLPPNIASHPSKFHLRHAHNNEGQRHLAALLVELTVFDVGNFAYDPPDGHVPQGDVQWFVRHHGDSDFAPYGERFRYRTERGGFFSR